MCSRARHDRASGLTTNPCLLRIADGRGAALAATRWQQSQRPPLMLGLVGVFAFCGEPVRIASRPRRNGPRARVPHHACRLEARVAAARSPDLRGHARLGRIRRRSSVTARAPTRRVTSGVASGRIDVWRYGWSAFSERPVFGWGLGRFRAAIQEHMSATFVRDHVSDDRVPIIFDAHNIVVELTVTLGVVGLVLAGVFAWHAGRRRAAAHSRRSSSPSRSRWFLQPAALSTLPIAMIALGASRRETDRAADIEPGHRSPTHRSRSRTGRRRRGSRRSRWSWALCLAVVARRGRPPIERRPRRDGCARRIDDAAEWFPTDPVISDLVAQAWFVEEEFDQTLRPHVLEWSDRTVDVEPDRAYWWVRLAGRQLAFGDLDGVKASLDEALERQPMAHACRGRSWSCTRSAPATRRCRRKPTPNCASSTRHRVRLTAV